MPDFSPMGCQKGASWSRSLYGPDRVMYPLKRAGERGDGKWERVSWDQALTEIAESIVDAIENDGSTNGSMNPDLLREMVDLSLISGGCIKFDIKTWNDSLHTALCGVSNERRKRNFEWVAQWINRRPEPPLLIASTLLVPGYIDEGEVREISKWIASLNPDIPYSLLAFSPQFFFRDLPVTSKQFAFGCKEVAEGEGLRRVKMGNFHLIGNDSKRLRRGKNQ